MHPFGAPVEPSLLGLVLRLGRALRLRLARAGRRLLARLGRGPRGEVEGAIARLEERRARLKGQVVAAVAEARRREAGGRPSVDLERLAAEGRAHLVELDARIEALHRARRRLREAEAGAKIGAALRAARGPGAEGEGLGPLLRAEQALMLSEGPEGGLPEDDG